MLSNRPFLAAVFISLFAHAAILLQNPDFNFLPKNDKPEKFEISYVEESKQPRQIVRDKKFPEVKKEPFLKLSPMLTAAKVNPPPPFTDNQQVFKKKQESMQQRPFFARSVLSKPDIIAVKKKITLPALDLDKPDSPSYINYYQLVREKIKRTAYQNYARIEIGEVYLSFVVSADGYIRDMHIVDGKSSYSPYLRQIALNSINDASPFPKFPEDLDYPQLSFNVVISFEAE